MTNLARYLLGYEQAQTITTRTYDGEHWYMASDICGLLGISNHSVAVHGRRKDAFELDDTEWRKETVYIGGYGKKNILMVNDSGMLKLIMQSKSEGALAIRKRAESKM